MQEGNTTASGAPALDFRGITCRFPGKPGKPDYTATENVSFAVGAANS